MTVRQKAVWWLPFLVTGLLTLGSLYKDLTGADATAAQDIAVLKAQRLNDSERLQRIENKVDRTPAGARILEVLKQIVVPFDFNIVVQGATPTSFALRTRTLSSPQKALLLNTLRDTLYQQPRMFYAVLEAPGKPTEHLRVQERQGVTYSVYDFLCSH